MEFLTGGDDFTFIFARKQERKLRYFKFN